MDDIDDKVATKPYVVVSGNTFTHCQSYVSGNALYFRGTRQRGSTNETAEVCGAGFNVNGNTFTENSPILHVANGGAVSLECDFVSADASAIAGGASNVISVEPF